jgi:(1->4)-alpha-D-glucan 1-alpha-D-glucosylmutase
VYNRLISLNEVGGCPQCADVSKNAFDSFLQHRHKKWPFVMNTTMTHDAKRAEDVRARINVLSEIPEEWDKRLNQWSLWNDPKCQIVKGVRAPERNEEILLYQTLLGSWPVGTPACQCYTRRIQDFMVKAVREAMVHTRWTVPNIDHEQALTDFVGKILEESEGNHFLADFKTFAAKIAYHGALNSLSQLVIKLMSPGVADFYQGTELWDLRLVDPDNRNAVDFQMRDLMLASLQEKPSAKDLTAGWQDSRIKMYVTQRGLHARRGHPALFLKGEYIPLETQGAKRDCIIAIARRYRGEWCIAATPRFTTRLSTSVGSHQLWDDWGDTSIALPREIPQRWVDVYSDKPERTIQDRTILVGELLKEFPVAMLWSE